MFSLNINYPLYVRICTVYCTPCINFKFEVILVYSALAELACMLKADG